MNVNILIVGVGGQGTVLTSKIIGEAALLADLDVKQSEVHGMAQRGGSVVTHVKFGKKIFSPLIEKSQADYVLAFEILEGLRWHDYLRRNGKLIYSSQKIMPMPVITGASEYPDDVKTFYSRSGINFFEMEVIDEALKLGDKRTANVILLGALARQLDIPINIWQQAIKNIVKPATDALNQRAFQLGWEMAKND